MEASWPFASGLIRYVYRDQWEGTELFVDKDGIVGNGPELGGAIAG